MGFDLVDGVGTETVFLVGEETPDQVFGLVSDHNILRKAQIFVVHDGCVGARQGLGVERGVAKEHLVNHDTKGPPIRGPAVGVLLLNRLKGLWGDIVRCSHAHRG